MVEVAEHDVELLFSDHVLVVRNSDTPGVIGRVGTYLGDQGINIDNMVVGQSRATGMAAMMGVNMNRALAEDLAERERPLLQALGQGQPARFDQLHQ